MTKEHINLDKSKYQESAMPEWKVTSGKRGARLLKLLLMIGIAWELLLLSFIINDPNTDANGRAIILMGFFGLWVGWIGICGTVMFLIRNKVKTKMPGPDGHWMLAFVVFAVALLMLEEVFTVSMTNMYAVFGGEYGKAFITASDNYWEVVCLHSVIVLWPSYVFWAWWLKKYDVHPNWVMILYGLTGLWAEISYGGPQAVIAIGQWVFVYGLTIYLPAYCVPADRGAERPKATHYIIAPILAILFQLPMIGLVFAYRTAVGHVFPFVAN